MTDEDKVKNIISFLFIIFSETIIDTNDMLNLAILNIPPDYLIEKFERYILSNRVEHPWGIHPTLRHQLFNRYCKKWGNGRR